MMRPCVWRFPVLNIPGHTVLSVGLKFIIPNLTSKNKIEEVNIANFSGLKLQSFKLLLI